MKLSIKIMLLTMFALSFSSCNNDLFKTDTDETVTIRVSFAAKGNGGTRALSGSNEDAVRDITVLVFNSSGNIIGSGYGTFTSSPYTMNVTTHVGSGCTVYAIANTHSSTYFSGINTISELNAVKATTLSTAATLGANNNDIIMSGEQTGVNISTNGGSINIAMAHLCSKLNFTIVPASGITITGYQLCSVPLGSYITDSHSAVTASPGGYGNFDAVTLSSPTAGTTVTPSTYYVYENLTGSNASSTTEALRTSANAPSNAAYLLVYAKGATWHAIYYIYLGEATSSGTTDYTNYNIYRNRNYSYTVNIYGMGQSDSRVSWFPEIGEYYYSDGTFGTSASPSGKTVIGVIFSNSTSATDKSHGWTHGYAMALTNAQSNVLWASTSSGYNDSSVFGSDKEINTVSLMENDLDGYSHSQIVKNISGSNLQNYFPAFYYALNYGTSNIGGTKYALPSNTSGWYLPSIGQLFLVLKNIGNITKTFDYNSTNDANANYNYGEWYTPASYDAASSINAYLNNVGGEIIDTNSSNKTYIWFWSSSEYSDTHGCTVGFDGTGNLYFSSLSSKDGTSIYWRIRSVFAF